MIMKGHFSALYILYPYFNIIASALGSYDRRVGMLYAYCVCLYFCTCIYCAVLYSVRKLVMVVSSLSESIKEGGICFFFVFFLKRKKRKEEKKEKEFDWFC